MIQKIFSSYLCCSFYTIAQWRIGGTPMGRSRIQLIRNACLLLPHALCLRPSHAAQITAARAFCCRGLWFLPVYTVHGWQRWSSYRQKLHGKDSVTRGICLQPAVRRLLSGAPAGGSGGSAAAGPYPHVRLSVIWSTSLWMIEHGCKGEGGSQEWEEGCMWLEEAAPSRRRFEKHLYRYSKRSICMHSCEVAQARRTGPCRAGSRCQFLLPAAGLHAYSRQHADIVIKGPCPWPCGAPPGGSQAPCSQAAQATPCLPRGVISQRQL